MPVSWHQDDSPVSWQQDDSPVSWQQDDSPVSWQQDDSLVSWQQDGTDRPHPQPGLGRPLPRPTGNTWSDRRQAEPVVGGTRALWGKAGGPGFTPRRPGAAAKRTTGGLSPWQRSQRLWSEAGIQWEHSPAEHTPDRLLGSDPVPPELVNGGRTLQPQLVLSAPVFAAPGTGSADGQDPQPEAGEDLRPAGAGLARQTQLLEPPDDWQPDSRRRLVRRRPVAIAVPVIVLVAVAALALTMLTGHGPKFGQLAANTHAVRPSSHGTTGQAPLTIGMYSGQQQRGVSETVSRIVASGNTIVAIGSQASDGFVRQQFFVSTNGGASWRLATVRTPGGGQPPLGHLAVRLAGGPGGWLAVGPEAIWTSPDGLSWTLAATHGITPQLPGDAVWVLTATAQGYLAAGTGAAGGGASQAVIWTSRDGLTWQRETAAQLQLGGPGETVRTISYATSRGQDTVISGTVIRGGAAYSGAWLSTDGGSEWARVTVPVDHGAEASISGLGFDGSGLIAVRPGLSADGAGDGVVYFSPNGLTWQFSATIGAAGGWAPSLVKGSDYGFVVTGVSAAGQIVAFTSTGTATVWQPAAPLGNAAGETVAGVTVGPASTIIAVGQAAGTKAGQQPLFVEATAAGSMRPVSLTGIPGAVVPELAVNGLAEADGQQVAVGSADGYPAVWRKEENGKAGALALVSSLPQVSTGAGLTALSSVAHSSAGWLAVGAPGPTVLTSADGTAWQSAAGPGSITDDLAGVAAVAAAAGPAGYVIVGKLVAPNGVCVADVWWSPNLTSWTRAHDVNDVSGSSQVLAVAADAHGFVSVGSHDGQPAVWTTTDGRTWTTIVLPTPAGASGAVLQQVAINGDRVAALGQETTPSGILPFAELSVNGGASWSQVPFGAPGPDTAITALTASSGGFTAAGQFGEPGQRQVALWTSANGTAWAQPQVTGLTGTQSGGSHQITALAAAGSSVTGIGTIATQDSQDVFTVPLPAP